MTDEQKKKLANKADYMAGLQFNPKYSKDAYTACKISFINGAQWVIDNPGGVGLTTQPEQSFSREEVVSFIEIIVGRYKKLKEPEGEYKFADVFDIGKCTAGAILDMTIAELKLNTH